MEHSEKRKIIEKALDDIGTKYFEMREQPLVTLDYKWRQDFAQISIIAKEAILCLNKK